MAAKLSFESFSRGIESGEISLQYISRFVELDPDAPVIRLRVRPGIFTDPVPESIDVDELVYRLDQQDRQIKLERRPRLAARLARVVADGDSWFCLPSFIPGFPTAIADRIHKDKMFDVDNVAKWGDTIRQRIEKKRYLQELSKKDADWLILSAGGNDMQISLAKHEFLHPYDAARPLDQAISSKGKEVLKEVAAGYTTILTEVGGAHPNVKILCYAYDYPKPSPQHREYIGKHLDAMGYPRPTWGALVKVIMGELSSSIMGAVSKVPGVRFLDCFGVAQPWSWFNDMHPDDAGFKALAKWFEAHMATATHALALHKRPLHKSVKEKSRKSQPIKKKSKKTRKKSK